MCAGHTLRGCGLPRQGRCIIKGEMRTRICSSCSPDYLRRAAACCDRRVQVAAPLEARVGVDTGRGARRRRVSAGLRKMPLSDIDPRTARTGPSGHHQDPSHALGRAAYRRASDRGHPARPRDHARHCTRRSATARPACLPAHAMSGRRTQREHPQSGKAARQHLEERKASGTQARTASPARPRCHFALSSAARRRHRRRSRWADIIRSSSCSFLCFFSRHAADC